MSAHRSPLLVTAAVLWATISASIGAVACEEKSNLAVFQFTCGPRTHPRLLFNDPRIEGTGWVRQDGCSQFPNVAGGALPDRSDYDMRYGVAMTCNHVLFLCRTDFRRGRAWQ
jgi:hypothetical protein